MDNDFSKLHDNCFVVDLHCDTLLDLAAGHRSLTGHEGIGHTDLTRMIKGNVKVQFFAAFIESVYKPERALKRLLQLIDVFYREIENSSHLICPCFSNRQISRELKNNKIIALLAVEGGEALAGDLAVLRMLYRLGVRAMGLTWNQRNEIADGVAEAETGGGLTVFGRQVVSEMNRLGMIIDLAHIAEAGFWDVLTLSDAPVMVSHANCYALCPHPRNLKRDQIKALSDKGGVIGLSFVPEFVGTESVSLEQFLDHVDFIAGLVGTGCIAVGSDFDGIENTIPGLEDASKYVNITRGLKERGYTAEEIKGIMGGNALRLIQKVLR